MSLDPEIFKAILGTSFFAAFGAIYAALIKRGTDRDAHKNAEARLILEREKEAYEERFKEREQEAARRKELREELQESRKRETELEVRCRNLDRIYTERVTACREAGYICVRYLKKGPESADGSEP